MWIEELSFLTILICFQIYKVKTSISVNVAMNATSRQIGRYCHSDWWICSSAHLLLLSCPAHFANLLWHYMGYNPGYREAKNCHLVMLLFLFWYFNPLFSGSGDKYFFALSHISGGGGSEAPETKEYFLHTPLVYIGNVLIMLVMYS